MHFTKFRLLTYKKIFYTKYCTIQILNAYSISWKVLNKFIPYNQCEIPVHNKFDEGLWKKFATLRVIVQTSYKILNEKLVFPVPLPYYFIHIHVLLCCLF